MPPVELAYHSKVAPASPVADNVVVPVPQRALPVNVNKFGGKQGVVNEDTAVHILVVPAPQFDLT